MDDIDDDFKTAMTELTVVENGSGNELTTRQEETREPTREIETRDPESLPANRKQDEERQSRDEDDEDDEYLKEKGTELVEKKEDEPTGLKPPASWKATVRDHWSKLPVEVQSEVVRREREVARILSKTDTQRKYAEEIAEVIRPYEHHIRAENSNHVQAVEHLMQTAHILRSAPAPQKAAMVAELIFRHDVNIAMLDQYLMSRLEGRAPSMDPAQAAIQQELAPIKQFMEEIRSTRTQSAQVMKERAETQWDEFVADPKNEFAEDVREEMADLLELSASRGRKLSLQDAYARATMAHPRIGPILAKRQLAEQAQRESEKAKRARQAGASVGDSDAPPADKGNEDDFDDLGSAIKASIREISRN